MELTAWLPQLSAVGLLLGLAVMTALGRGVVGRKIYDDALADKQRALQAALAAIEAATKAAASVDRLVAAVEAQTTASRAAGEAQRALAAEVASMRAELSRQAGTR